MKSLLKVLVVVGLMVFCLGTAFADCTLEQRTQGLCEQNLFFQNKFSGGVYVWSVNITKSGFVSGQNYLGAMSPEWQMKIEDLDGDGKNDILWRNTNTGEIRYWLVQSLQKYEFSPNLFPGPEWVLK